MVQRKKIANTYKKRNQIQTKYNQFTDITKNKRRLTKYSSKTKIRSSALNELNDISVIYILGGKPTYIHSRQAYFEAGLKTASVAFEQMLARLIEEQKSIMQQKAIWINKAWELKLNKAFGTSIPTFKEFKKWWEIAVMNEQNPSDLFNRLVPLLKLKEAQTRKNVLEYLKSTIRKSLKGETNTNIRLQKMREALAPYSISVNIQKNGTFSYDKTLEHIWLEIIKKSAEQAWLKPGDALDEQALLDFTEKQINNLIKGGDIIPNATDIGNLFEARSIGIWENIQNNISGLEDKIISLIIENVAAEKHKLDSTKYKADSNIKIALDGDIVMDFLTSDKSGQTLEFGLDDMVNAPIIEQFTASLESSTLDFSHFGIDSSTLRADNNLMQKIFNYVYSNYAAHNINIDDFKENIVLYAAWLKICSEIVGDTSIKQTPLAIRTMKTLYNTADLLNVFVDISAKEMLKFLNQSKIKDFYKKGITLNGIDKDMLFIEKKLAIMSSFGNKLQENSSSSVNYLSLYNNVRINRALQELQATIKKPSLHTSFIIKLTNMPELD